jgi:hypothetical protein
LHLPIAVLRYTWKDYGPHFPGLLDAEFNKIFTSPTWGWSIPNYWADATLGMLDLASGSRVFPWRVSKLDQALVADPDNPGGWKSNRTFSEIVSAALDDHDDDFEIEKFGVIVIFVDPPPSKRGGYVAASRFDNVAVLDWKSPQSVMCHEVGHAFMLPHSGDFVGFDYGDPYCSMSNETNTYMFSLSTVLPDPNIPSSYFLRMGPRCAAATLFENFSYFRGSPRIVEVPSSARDTHQSITLRNLSRASQGDPVLAVIEVDGFKWTVEYRVLEDSAADNVVEAAAEKGWDQGLPSSAVVVHKLQYPNPLPTESATSLYQGSIRTPFDREVRDWQAINADVGLIVGRADDDAVAFHFCRKQHHAVELDYERTVLSTFRTPRQRKTFPVWNGLCGDAEFDYDYEAVRERLILKARPLGYVDPAFTWKVNGQPIAPGGKTSVSTTRYDDDGVTVAKSAALAKLQAPSADDASPPNPLPLNQLWIENDPADGTFDLSVEVEVRDQGPRPWSQESASIADQFEGRRIEIYGKEEADQKCRNYWNQLGDKFPKDQLTKLIHKGDPVWRVLDERLPPLAQAERDLIARLIASARLLRSSEPQRAREITEAISRRLRVPEAVITPG